MAVMRTYETPVIERQKESSGAWLFMAMLLALAFLFLVFYYGIPALRTGTSSPQISVPEQIDVNVNRQ